MLINHQSLDSYAVSESEAKSLLDADLVEVCEMHSHGFLIELIAVASLTDLTDDGEFDGIIMIAGDIEGNYETEGTFNVTCIGSSFKRVGEQRYYAISFGDDEKAIRDQIIARAAMLLCEREKTPVSV